jgi:hypothetical protein
MADPLIGSTSPETTNNNTICFSASCLARISQASAIAKKRSGTEVLGRRRGKDVNDMDVPL